MSNTFKYFPIEGLLAGGLFVALRFFGVIDESDVPWIAGLILLILLSKIYDTLVSIRDIFLSLEEKMDEQSEALGWIHSEVRDIESRIP